MYKQTFEHRLSVKLYQSYSFIDFHPVIYFLYLQLFVSFVCSSFVCVILCQSCYVSLPQKFYRNSCPVAAVLKLIHDKLIDEHEQIGYMGKQIMI